MPRLMLLPVTVSLLTAAAVVSGSGASPQPSNRAAQQSTPPTHMPRGPSAPVGTSTVTRRTFLYVKGKRHRFYIDCYSPRVDPGCDAGWIDPELGRWAFHLDSRTWVTGYESQRSAHYDGYARQRSPRRWGAWPRWGGWGGVAIVLHGARRWDIYKKGSLVGYAIGLNGVAAGLMWLADPAPR